jgi:hypothetical protein
LDPQIRRIEEDCRTTSEANEQTEIRTDINEAEVEYFGDKLAGRIPNMLRIGFLNINGVPGSAAHQKNKEILNNINNSYLDILGLAETNRCWHKLATKDRWMECTRGWWETQKTVLAYNLNENEISSEFQPGGVSLTSINKPAHHIIETGKDPVDRYSI